MKATAPTAEQPPHVSNHTFPNDGVTLEFLQSIAASPKMKQPMYELAGMTKSEVDAADLDSLRNICKEYHVLGTAGMPDTEEYPIYEGTIPKSKQFFVDALCQLPTTMQHVYSVTSKQWPKRWKKWRMN